MGYNGVIFDLDGTLLDTLQDLADSMNQVLAERGLPTHPTESFRRFVGNGVAKLVSRALPPGKRSEAVTSDCLKAFLNEYDRNWNRKTHPYSGVPKLLDDLTERKIPMAVFTNKLQDFAERCIREFLSEWRFASILGQRDGLPGKPDPTGALEIAAQLNVPAQEFLYLGDSDVDMKTALNAGMVPVGALWGFRTEKELREAGAVRLISRPEELLDVVR